MISVSPVLVGLPGLDLALASAFVARGATPRRRGGCPTTGRPPRSRSAGRRPHGDRLRIFAVAVRPRAGAHHLRSSLEARPRGRRHHLETVLVDAPSGARSSVELAEGVRDRRGRSRTFLADEFDVLSVVEATRTTGYRLSLTSSCGQRDAVQERAMLQALEVIRRRVDDPADGDPGVGGHPTGQRPHPRPDSRASSVVPPTSSSTTGFLEFKIVQDVEVHGERRGADARALSRRPARPAPSHRASSATARPIACSRAYLVPESSPTSTGDFLDGRPGASSTTSAVNEWQVAFTWNAERRAQIFGDAHRATTWASPLAVILDRQGLQRAGDPLAASPARA